MDTQQIDVQNDDSVLAYTQGIRVNVVKELTTAGAVPKDNSDRNLLMSALDGLDRVALGKKRLAVEQRSSANDQAAQALIAKMLLQVGGRRLNEADVIDMPAREIPLLGNDIPEPELVPGETSINDGADMNYDKFMQKFQTD